MRKVKLTREEEAAVRERINPACPGTIRLKGGLKLRCGSREVCYMGGKANEHFYYCYRCGNEWDWTNPQGQRLTRKEYGAMIERRQEAYRADSGKTFWLDGKEAPEGDGTMAKKKAKKKKGSKGGKGSTFGREPGAAMQDERIPKAGTVLHARYKGQNFKAVVKANGILFNGTLYSSVSQAGKAAKGGKETNGYTFWNLDGKTKKAPKASGGAKKSAKKKNKKKTKTVR